MLLTNATALAKLNGRRVKRTKRGAKGKKGKHQPLCRRYKDSHGRPAYCGTKWLKKSQKLFGRISEMFRRCALLVWEVTPT